MKELATAGWWGVFGKANGGELHETEYTLEAAEQAAAAIYGPDWQKRCTVEPVTIIRGDPAEWVCEIFNRAKTHDPSWPKTRKS